MARKVAGRIRTYTFELANSIPPSCADFQSYIQEEITGARRLMTFNPSNKNGDCVVDLTMECWSCGRNGPNNFKRDLFINFPNVTIKSFYRIRNNRKRKLIKSTL